MNKIKHIFFDLDRTLWDFEKNSHDTLKELYAEFGLEQKIKTDHHKFISTYKTINEAQWALYREGKIEKDDLRTLRYSKTFEHFNLVDMELAELFGQAYIDRCPLKTGLLPGTIDVLNFLSEKYDLHIITNGFEEVQETKLKVSGLTDYFEVIMSSERAQCKKPGTEIFIQSLNEAGAQAYESLMVGDHYEVDILGAENVGMQAILFDPYGNYISVSERKIRSLHEMIPMFGL